MFNIARFSAHIKDKGTLQTNKFMVRILRPPAVVGKNQSIDASIEYRANSVKVPGVSLDLQNVSRYGLGPQQKFPTNVNFTDIDINFVDMTDNAMWKYFASWMNSIFDYTGSGGQKAQASYGVEYKKYYETDISINIFNNDGRLTNIIVLKEAFPISLSDVSLSWSENNRLYEFNVRFAFKEWYYEGYSSTNFDSGARLGPGQTAQVIPQRTESPRPTQTEYSSATNRSFGNGPENPTIRQDVQNSINAPTDLQNNRAGGPFRSDQTITGANEPVVAGPLTWLRNLFGGR
jgi:hypothetical protein